MHPRKLAHQKATSKIHRKEKCFSPTPICTSQGRIMTDSAWISQTYYSDPKNGELSLARPKLIWTYRHGLLNGRGGRRGIREKVICWLETIANNKVHYKWHMEFVCLESWDNYDRRGSLAELRSAIDFQTSSNNNHSDFKSKQLCTTLSLKSIFHTLLTLKKMIHFPFTLARRWVLVCCHLFRDLL